MVTKWRLIGFLHAHKMEGNSRKAILKRQVQVLPYNIMLSTGKWFSRGTLLIEPDSLSLASHARTNQCYLEHTLNNISCYLLCYYFEFFAAATAKSLQSCPTLCDPIDGSPPGSPVPGILQARTLEWVAIYFSKAWKWKVKVKSLSPVRPSATPSTAAFQAPPSMGFSRQEYWSWVPWPCQPSITTLFFFLSPTADSITS